MLTQKYVKDQFKVVEEYVKGLEKSNPPKKIKKSNIKESNSVFKLFNVTKDTLYKRNVIYFIKDEKYKVIYIGKTKQTMLERHTRNASWILNKDGSQNFHRFMYNKVYKEGRKIDLFVVKEFKDSSELELHESIFIKYFADKIKEKGYKILNSDPIVKKLDIYYEEKYYEN